MAPELVQLVVLYLMAVNLAAFFLMGVDKRRAVGKKWRISEKTLFLPAALFYLRLQLLLVAVQDLMDKSLEEKLGSPSQPVAQTGIHEIGRGVALRGI